MLDTVMTAQLRDDLIRDEGMRLHPYQDTMGVLTIGVGRNLEDRGITKEEAMMLLDGDIKIFTDELDKAVPWWRDLPEPAARALMNMAFNLGLPRLMGFKRMVTALERGDFHEAAEQALASRWAEQVKGRAHRIADLFREASTTIDNRSRGDV